MSHTPNRNPDTSNEHPALEDAIYSSLGPVESSLVVDGDEPIPPDENIDYSIDLSSDSSDGLVPPDDTAPSDDSTEQARAKRRDLLKAGVPLLAATTLAGVLLANTLSIDEPDNSPPAPTRTIEQETAASAPVAPDKFGFNYTDVKVHYVKFAGATAFQGDKQKIADDVTAGLRILDTAHKGQLGISDLPVATDPAQYDLGATGVSIDQFCNTPPGADAGKIMHKTIVDALSQQTPVSDKTLNIIITQADKACYGIPGGSAYGNDIVMYQVGGTIKGKMAHEMNHQLGYGHDGTYIVERNGNIISLTPEPNRDNYGNWHTIAGSGASQLEITDPDPLSGYELYDHGVIRSEQVVDVERGASKEIQINALNNASAQDAKLIHLPLEAGVLTDASSVMLELSTEGGHHTLKAYGTTEFELTKGTVAFPLGPDGRQLGLDKAAVGQPVFLNLGGEKIEINLKKLNEGDQPTAVVKIARS